MDSRESRDIAVVGGGHVGLIGAIALHKLGFSVVVVSNQKHTSKGKIFSINNSSYKFLKDIGINIPASCASPLYRTKISDGKSEFVISELDSKSFPISYIIKEDDFVYYVSAAIDAAKLEIIKDECSSASVCNKTNIITTKSNRTIQARLLLGADGVNSMVRQAMPDQSIKTIDYHQTAVCGTITHSYDNSSMSSLEVFLEDEMIALLPIARHTSAYIWTHNAAFKPEDTTKTIKALCIPYIGAVDEVKVDSQFPLYGLLAERQSYQRSILLGSSHCSIHPVAGQGLNLGIQDVMLLHKSIQTNPNFINSCSAIRSYSKQRRKHIMKIWHFTNVVHPLLGSGIFRFPRALAFFCINNIGMIRKHILNYINSV